VNLTGLNGIERVSTLLAFHRHSAASLLEEIRLIMAS
jgi:hypothetical protein